ncbi:type II toxin-antitoxin system HicA family toxin [Cardiobacterium hominis]|uniref:type II toxin-antitoxin system HicA family toxin n=1 Tax=Cardiobacterium hominis TaxID=2718 RepID=UPI0028E89AB0|nr:type II toxin-antitoxin system HicA family toxin [Cardiobacterium hominis]
MKSGDVIKKLEADGWKLQRVSGSHHIFAKDGVTDIITISHPKKDMTIGQVKDAEKISGLRFR